MGSEMCIRDSMIGNVWEWTADPAEHRPAHDGPQRIQKGGSYLCHESYCRRYRPAARLAATADSSSDNVGLRVVFTPAV